MIFIDVPITADLLIQIFQGEASSRALERSVSAAESGDLDEADTWMRVAGAIERLEAHARAAA